MRSVRAGRFLPVAAVCAVALVVAGCSSGDDDDTPTNDPSGAAAGGEQVPLQSQVGRVRGNLSAKQASEVATNVSKEVDSWFQAAFLGGEYPRTDFGNAFPGFTPGAAQDAERDAALLTNQQ